MTAIKKLEKRCKIKKMWTKEAKTKQRFEREKSGKIENDFTVYWNQVDGTLFDDEIEKFVRKTTRANG